MFEATLKQLWDSHGSLRRAASVKYESEPTAWAISRIYQKSEEEMKTLQKHYYNLLLKYGAPVTNAQGELTGEYKEPLGGEKLEAFEAEWAEITKHTVQLYGQPLKRSAVAKADILPIDKAALSWLIVDEVAEV